MAFNSEEVNFLVYRYLEESGFRHSAYTFSHESNIMSSVNFNISIPRGALLSLLQKAILFVEAEVFSLISEGDIDARFEKAIGSMSLLECSLCETQKVKILHKNTSDIVDDVRPSSHSSNAHSSSSARAPSTSDNTNNQIPSAPSLSSAPTLQIEIGVDGKPKNSVPSPSKRINSLMATTSYMDCDPGDNVCSSNGNSSPSSRQQIHRDREFRAHQTMSVNNSLQRCAYRQPNSVQVDLINPHLVSVSTSLPTIPDNNSENINVSRKIGGDSVHTTLSTTKSKPDNYVQKIPANPLPNGLPESGHTIHSPPFSLSQSQLHHDMKISVQDSEVRTNPHYLMEPNGVAQVYMSGRSSGTS